MFHELNKFCDALDCDAADTIYSDIIDTGYANVGDVEQIILEVWSEIDGDGAGTLDITLQSSNNEAFTHSGASIVKDEFSLPQKAAANLAKGQIFEGALPKGLYRYLRLKLVTTTGFTSGKCLITAALRNQG